MTTSGVVAAVDVGGTTIKGLLVAADGRAAASIERPTPVAAGADAVITAIRATVGALVERADEPVRAVGLAVPGDVDPGNGMARYSANLGWRDVPAAAFVDVGGPAVPVVLEHDVRCAALADRTIGVSRGVPDACIIVIGTGIASVSISGGVPVSGARGLAGELGHVAVRPGGERCACGQFGCLETYASAAAIARRYAAATGTVRATHDIVAALPDDDAAAQVWGDAVAALATGCVAVTMLQDPDVIVLAGGLAEAGDALVQPLRAAVAGQLTWRTSPRIEVSPLAGRAGRYGIAIRAWQAAGLPDEAIAGWDVEAAR